MCVRKTPLDGEHTDDPRVAHQHHNQLLARQSHDLDSSTPQTGTAVVARCTSALPAKEALGLLGEHNVHLLSLYRQLGTAMLLLSTRQTRTVRQRLDVVSQTKDNELVSRLDSISGTVCKPMSRQTSARQEDWDLTYLPATALLVLLQLLALQLIPHPAQRLQSPLSSRQVQDASQIQRMPDNVDHLIMALFPQYQHLRSHGLRQIQWRTSQGHDKLRPLSLRLPCCMLSRRSHVSTVTNNTSNTNFITIAQNATMARMTYAIGATMLAKAASTGSALGGRLGHGTNAIAQKVGILPTTKSPTPSLGIDIEHRRRR